ncbi:MAG: carbon-nitrogen hydrolase family protein [Planctomycetes bacterium]|nr:carbon-nitrogen hydrolase family protein [Planctomycetota bacterium]
MPANRLVIREKLRAAAAAGAHLVVFPECILTGYGFESAAEAREHSEPLPGPTTEMIADDCKELGVWCLFGLLERDGDRLFNSCALVGPSGFVAGYRKIHLPILGVDRFTTPGNRPFAVHDLGGLKIGINICYDGSFPESSRVLALLGADLILLPTNWPSGARPMVLPLAQARAIENHVYYAAVNRVGEERGFQYIGCSRVIDFNGNLVSSSPGDEEDILLAEIEPLRAREKEVVVVPNRFIVNRVGHRRPEMYQPILKPSPFDRPR